METRLGVAPPDYNSSPEGQLIKELKIYPDQPLITKANGTPSLTITSPPRRKLPCPKTRVHPSRSG